MRLLLLSLLACSADKGADSGAPPDSDAPFVAPAISLSPSALDLGDVDAPGEVQDIVVVQSQGPGAVQVLSATLSAGGGGLEVMPSEPLPLTLDARQTTGLGLRCRPTEPGALTDTLNVTVSWLSDEGVEQRSVLQAEVRCEGHAPLLERVTSDLAFGPLGVPCEADGAWRVLNVGDLPGTITAVTQEGGEGFTVDLDAAGQLPWQLSPGELLSLPVSFAPTQSGAQALTLTLTADIGEPVVLTASGEGLFDEQVVDSFVVTPVTAVDVLMAVNHSATGVVFRGIAALEELSTALEASGLGWRLAAVTQDSGCVDEATLYVDGDLTAEERERVITAQYYGRYGGDTEAPFTLLERALDESGVGGCNEGLRRSEAALALIALSDEAEQSASGFATYVARYLTEVSAEEWLTVNAIAGDYPSCNDASAERGFYEAALATRGLLLSSCSFDYGAHYQDIIENIQPDYSRFTPSGSPVVDTLEVFVDGVALESGWGYSSATNEVVLTSQPASGAAVELRYYPEAPCGG